MTHHNFIVKKIFVIQFLFTKYGPVIVCVSKIACKFILMLKKTRIKYFEKNDFLRKKCLLNRYYIKYLKN